MLWLMMFVTLAITLSLLSWIYSASGGDLGLGGWRRESVIAAVAALLQAAVLWVALMLALVALGRMVPIAMLLLCLTYRLTHLTSNFLEETSEVTWLSCGAIAATQAGVLAVVSLVLSIYFK